MQYPPLLIPTPVRAILHDWPWDKCRTILKVVREAAGPSSKLIVFDMMMPYACEYTGPFADVVNGEKAPYPLLANLGLGMGGFVTWIDIQVSHTSPALVSPTLTLVADDEPSRWPGEDRWPIHRARQSDRVEAGECQARHDGLPRLLPGVDDSFL